MYGHVKESDLEREVAGEYNTFRVYLFMLRAKDGSVRQVQKALGFSSPTLARHHLRKLESLNLAKKDPYGNYHVIPRSFGILKSFIIVGSFIVPRTIFIAAMFATMTCGFLINLPRNENLLWALIPSVVGLVVSVYQTIRYHRLLSNKLYKK